MTMEDTGTVEGTEGGTEDPGMHRPLEGSHSRLLSASEVLRRNIAILYDVTTGLAAETGDPFFDALTEHLGRELSADYVLVAELLPGETGTVRTLAVRSGEKHGENFDYSLAGTPCETVVEQGVCSYSGNVQELFPADVMLVEMGVKSYAGSTLLGADGRPRGLLVTLMRRPLEDPELVETLLQLFASRAASELERRGNRRRLAESEERFRAIFESAAVGMCLVSEAGRILQSNRALEHFLGYGPGGVAGMLEEDLTWIEDREKTAEGYRQLKAGQCASFDVEKRYRRRDGEVIWGLATVAPVRGLGSNYFIALVQDIGARVAAAEVLRQGERMKDQFIATAAHELQTPLSVVMGYTELLLTGDGVGERKEEFLGEIYGKAEVLSGIVDNLLDLGRMTTGDPFPLVLSPCDLHPLVGEVVSCWRNLNPERRIDLELSGTGRGPLDVDRGRVVQVVENLLSNASKFSSPGDRIFVRGEETEDAYLLTVADEGIGMSDREQARAFDRFYRADTSNTAVGGLGLGLNIVRHIVEQHGGSVRLESKPSQGTRVLVTFPRRVSAAAPIPQLPVVSSFNLPA